MLCDPKPAEKVRALLGHYAFAYCSGVAVKKYSLIQTLTQTEKSTIQNNNDPHV